MVRAFALLCKLNSYKLSDKAIFDAFMTRLDLVHQTCPYCGSRSNHQIHSSYERNMISFIDGTRMDYTVSIPRIMCSCGHTHAVLPDVLIPYGSYSLRFILLILCQYLTRHCTIAQFCDKYQISQSTLYSWIHQFLEQFNCNGQYIYLQFSQKHDGTFGAVINPEGLAKLKAIYGVTPYGIGNNNCVYSASF